jgi:HEAT repeat protein
VYRRWREHAAQRLDTWIEHAGSPVWSVRAAAGRQLAASAQTGHAAEVLLRLLLDPHDTAVTWETADALLERGDALGLRYVLLAMAEMTSEWTMDELAVAVHDHCVRAAGEGSNRLIGHLEELTTDDDAGVREEALALLAELVPEQG